MTIYFGISCKYQFQVCNFTMIRINNIWMTSSLHKSKQNNMESSTDTAVAHSPNLYLKVVVGWYEGGKIVIQLANISIKFCHTSCSTLLFNLFHCQELHRSVFLYHKPFPCLHDKSALPGHTRFHCLLVAWLSHNAQVLSS